MAAAAATLLAACNAIPADPEQTTQRVRDEGQFRVGLIAGAPEQERVAAFLGGVSQATGADDVVVRGATEPLLKQLERGALDIVIGPMSAKSPWALDVHFVPLGKGEPAPPDYRQWTVMARNGENEWITLLHRQADAVTKR